jgi:hypothetical protein
MHHVSTHSEVDGSAVIFLFDTKQNHLRISSGHDLDSPYPPGLLEAKSRNSDSVQRLLQYVGFRDVSAFSSSSEAGNTMSS